MNNDQEEELKLSKTHFDAIKLLEGALQKMDGIISLGIYFDFKFYKYYKKVIVYNYYLPFIFFF